MKRLCWLCAIVLVLSACNRTKPQSPSNKTQEDDSLKVALVLLNQQLANHTDNQLTQMVKESGQPFVLAPNHCWYIKTEHTDKPLVRKGETLSLQILTYTLDSVLLYDEEITVEVGKQQTIEAVDMVLPMLNHEESAMVLAPWYKAYGSSGNAVVEPYTDLLLYIYLLN